jgi:hypothetical protein
MRPLIGEGREQGDGANAGGGRASVPGRYGPIDVAWSTRFDTGVAILYPDRFGACPRAPI